MSHTRTTVKTRYRKLRVPEVTDTVCQILNRAFSRRSPGEGTPDLPTTGGIMCFLVALLGVRPPSINRYWINNAKSSSGRDNGESFVQ